MRLSRRPTGFTLIEVVIAMMILSFLSLFTVQAIHQALATRTKVQGDIDKSSMVRDALRVMERDINMAFNYRDPNIALYNMTQQQRQRTAQGNSQSLQQQQQQQLQNSQINNSNAFPDPSANAVDPNKFKLKTEKIYTQFVGETDSLALTTLSNVRMLEESAVCSQAEIGYKLKPCRRRSTQTQSSNCLWRRVANYIHDDITRDDGQETVLLENVKQFKLRYLGPGREEEWVNQWITTERGDDQSRGKFPYAVEITLEVQDTSPGSKDKSLKVSTVAALRNPANPPAANDPKDGSNAQQPTQGATPAQPNATPAGK